MAVHLIEAHQVAVRHGMFCPACHLPHLTEVDVVLVSGDSLAVLGRATGRDCSSCPYEETVR